MAEFEFEIPGPALKALAKKFEDLKTPLNSSQTRDLGLATKKEMKKLISKGISPIAGKGRFPRYKGGYAEQIRRKGRVAGKPKKLRPVNLKLSGDFLKDLTSKTKRKRNQFVANVGYRTPSEQLKEEGHRKAHNNQAKRPTIPEKNEQLAASIVVKLIKIIDKAIGKIIRRPLK